MFLAKKSLGQHFLLSGGALRKMVEAAALKAGDQVVEVGPGPGALTELLLARGARVIAVEKDDRLISQLTEKFASVVAREQLKIIHEDILNFSPEKLADKNYKLIANIPYYITGAILEKFLTNANQPTRVVLMVQKEVAERVVAKDGRESVLSLSVKVYGNPTYIATVPAKFFRPRPQVDSAILLIEDISHERLDGINKERFFALIKKGFRSKRKMLRNNLPEAMTFYAECGLSEKVRPENLTVAQWQCLAKNL